jgi:hypothetical protein
MNSDQHGRWFRSRLFPFVTGQPLDVDLTFLANARQFAVPEVLTMELIFTGTVTPVGGTYQGEDTAKLFSRVNFRDEAEMINAGGNCLRHLAMEELGAAYVDPADINVGVATPVEYHLPILFEPPETKAVRPRDTRVPLANFLEGGNLVINLAAALPTNMGVVAGDWNVQINFFIKDGRVKEIKTRRRIWDQVVALQEWEYPINGSIRNALITSDLTTTGYTALTAFTTIFSRTLDLPPTFSVQQLREYYRRMQLNASAVDEFLAAAPSAIPFIIAERKKKIGQMIDTPTLHIDLLRAAPASGRLLVDAIVNRPPNITALAAGYGSPEELAAAIQSRGMVVGEGGNFPAKEAPRSLARKMCIRI